MDFYSDSEDLTWSVTSEVLFPAKLFCILLVNGLRVVVSISCTLYNQRKAVAQNFHSDKEWFVVVWCLRGTCPTLLDSTQLLH